MNKIKVPMELHKLPSLYWLPKLHKVPYENRFIVASNTKPLSKLLTACFNTIMTHFSQYCDEIYQKTGVSCFWIIKNSQQVLKI